MLISQRLYYRASAQSSLHCLHHMAIICHLLFHLPCWGESCLSKPLSGCWFHNKIWDSLFLHGNMLNPASLLADRVVAVWRVVGLSPVPCWGKKNHASPQGSQLFAQLTRQDSMGSIPWSPEDVPLGQGQCRDELPHSPPWRGPSTG